tara:strand:+ start:1195 stop:1905 length:711 start_codon:yes stop_codon:yes gene_type:complete
MISTGEYKISIIVPCFNEKDTIELIINKILEIKLENFEIIIVDDNSNDGSREIIDKLKINISNLKIVNNDQNYGKGRSIKNGIIESTGDIILIQDADLEYDPDDYPALILPFLKYNADVVYGSRFVGGNGPKRLHFFWHTIANKILTILTNIFTNLNMTDMETGYKVFKKKHIDPYKLEQNSFGIEPELTLKLAKKKVKFFEVPISYNGRSYEQGKKISLKDAFIAVYCIIKYYFF